MTKQFGTDPWILRESSVSPENLGKNAAIFTIANGHIGVRGGFEEAYDQPDFLRANGVFVHGFYAMEPIKYPEDAYGYAKNRQTMLAVADPLRTEIWINGEAFGLTTGTVLSCERAFDMRQGTLTRKVDWISPSGCRVKLTFERFVSQRVRQLLFCRITAETQEAGATIRMASYIDAAPPKQSTTSDSRSATVLDESAVRTAAVQRSENGVTSVEQQAPASHVSVGIAMAHAAEGLLEEAASHARAVFRGIPGARTVRLDKIVAIEKYDGLCGPMEMAALHELLLAARLRGYEAFQVENEREMLHFWRDSDVVIDGDPGIQQSIRLACLQLYFSVGRSGKTSLAAKGLTGNGYDGHYFWDTEIYALPFLVYTQPEIARQVLLYRHHTLPRARERARELGFSRGALYAWRTINGEECSPYYPAGTAQYHINADIAYAVNQYARVTGDHEFMHDFGAEILVETARLWLQLGFFNEHKGGKFCINCVTGPDEYTALVNNNCYTNLMAGANLRYAVSWLEELAGSRPDKYRELTDRLSIYAPEIEAWKEAAGNMYLPFDPERGLYLQDDEQDQRRPWPMESIPKESFPLLLHYHPLIIYRHLICKQADVLLAMLLLPDLFSKPQISAAMEYYERITTHDSSLSRAVFSVLACEIGDMEKAERLFRHIAFCDFGNLNGNTAEGLHMANMGGIWMCVVYGFAGLRITDAGLLFTPRCPAFADSLSFSLKYAGRCLRVRMTAAGADISLLSGEPITVFVDGQPREVNTI